MRPLKIATAFSDSDGSDIDTNGVLWEDYSDDELDPLDKASEMLGQTFFDSDMLLRGTTRM